MARRALILLIAAVAFSLNACGGNSSVTTPNAPSNGGSGSGLGDGNGSPPPTQSPNPSPNPSPTATGITVIEKATKDELLFGIAVGQDTNVYATTLTGVDIFTPALVLQPSPSPAPESRMVIPFTWPTVPKNAAPLGPVVSSGSTVSALGTSPTSAPSGFASSFASLDGPKPAPTSFPMLAQFSVFTKTWVNVVTGTQGDMWVSLASPGQNSVLIVGDHLTSSGWVGFLFGVGISCVSPVFVHPLGASAMGPDGNFWVATDPSLNSNSPSDPHTNPEILYAINPSTGTIVHQFTLPLKGAHISAIAAGNSAIWFTDDGLNNLGFVPISGSLMYPIALPNAGTSQAPVSISKDSLGRMWFTERNAKRVGYATPNGTTNPPIVIFKLTGSPLGIIGCAPGQNCPQTNVFFAESSAIGAATF